MHRYSLIIALLFIVSVVAPAQKNAITAEQVLEKVKANFDAVKDYSADLTVSVDMERLRVPKKTVRIYFKQPNLFKTESKNTSFLPKNIFDIAPGNLMKKFDAIMMGPEVLEGKNTHKIRLITKPEKRKPARESFIWVETEHWTIVRLEAYPLEGQLIAVRIENAVIDGKYVLPSAIHASFDAPPSADSLADKMMPSRAPRKGTVDLLYSDFKINTGLTDEFFEKKP